MPRKKTGPHTLRQPTPEEARLAGVPMPPMKYGTPDACRGLIVSLAKKFEADPLCIVLDGLLAQMGVSRSVWAGVMERNRDDEEFKDAVEILDQMIVDRLARMGIQKSFSDRMAIAMLHSKHGFSNGDNNQAQALPTVQIFLGSPDASVADEFKKMRVVQSNARNNVLEAPENKKAPAGEPGTFRELTNLDDGRKKSSKGHTQGDLGKVIDATEARFEIT